MTSELTTYTQRRAAIAAILESRVRVSEMADTTGGNTNPLEYDNGLHCSWGDPELGTIWISVSVKALADVAEAVARHREHVGEYALRGEDTYDPSTAREEPSDRDGEYIFVFGYVDSVRVVVGSCEVNIGTSVIDVALADLVQPALEIGRTVGCSPYEDDYVPPEIPEKWRSWTWGSPPFPPMQR
ncbi:hypothetical protein [Mycolicibacterium sp. 120270]|uniref:hypothetical protein n=1 Tax=Mycolicibacterium sp. 120270 TaxID=3090600 RepID=UPI00299E8A0E|nr:hypothetical protein [Mycolicibacterium sp. 120270]MDX1886764.1 hypothetical protein [Mycolicibacterium sp. 120270]